MEVLTFVFRLIEDNLNIEGGRNIMKVIKKCSESVRSMYYKDTLCREMFPISDEFIWPKESKLVELKASGNVVGHTDSHLIFILHSQVMEYGIHYIYYGFSKASVQKAISLMERFRLKIFIRKSQGASTFLKKMFYVFT